jgi:hypothetical protein
MGPRLDTPLRAYAHVSPGQRPLLGERVLVFSGSPACRKALQARVECKRVQTPRSRTPCRRDNPPSPQKQFFTDRVARNRQGKFQIVRPVRRDCRAYDARTIKAILSGVTYSAATT